MGICVLPNANSIDVIKRVRAEMEQIQKELPTGMKGEIAYDATAYINDAIHEVVKTLIDTLLIVMVVIFLVPRLVAFGARAGRRDSDFAHRRGFSHAGIRVHASICSRCWRSCSRSVWWSMTPSWWWKTSSAICAKA